MKRQEEGLDILEYKRNGLSFYVCIGEKKGWKIFKDGPSVRILIGRISVSFSCIDFEALLQDLLDAPVRDNGKTQRISELEKELEQKQELITKGNEDQRVLQEKVTELEGNLKSKDDSIEDLKGRIEDLTADKEELEEKVDKLDTDLCEASDENDSLEEINGELDTENEELREKVKKLTAKIDELGTELKDLAQLYDDQVEEIYNQFDDIVDLMEENEAAELEVEELRQRLASYLGLDSSSSSSSSSSE